MQPFFKIIVTKVKKIIINIIFLFALTLITGQNRGREIPVLKEISGFDIIQTIYPDAKEVEQINNIWFRIVNKENKVIGYTLSSMPYSKEIKGYHGPTPVIVILDKNKIIKGVSILSHMETTSYVRRLERQLFFDTWNGMSISDAIKERASVDSYSGATATAKSLSQNFELILKMALENNI